MTQLNLITIKEIMGIIASALSKTHWVMDKWGYTGSACVLMALDDAIEQGRSRQATTCCLSPGAVSAWPAMSGGGSHHEHYQGTMSQLVHCSLLIVN